MRKDLGLYAFKIKLTQELKPLDHLKRRNFSNWDLAKLEGNGFVNKQNIHYWSATNPNVLLETPLHP